MRNTIEMKDERLKMKNRKKQSNFDKTKAKDYFSSLIFHLSSSRGFTLIELIVVFSIVGIVSMIAIASFVSFSNSQTVEGAATEVANAYTLARERAISQIKPPSCTTAQPLTGYRVQLNNAARTYAVSALCGTMVVPISSKTLPTQVTFGVGSPTIIIFNVPNATVNTPGTVQVTGFGKSKSIRINGTGSISIS